MKSGWPVISIGMITLTLLAWLPQSGYAQSPSITAKVDRAQLSTDETLTLKVVISGVGAGRLPLSQLPFEGFDVVGRSTTSQMRFRNREVSEEVTYEYKLRPISAGVVTIDAISVMFDGKTFSTHPIKIDVSQGSARARLPLDTGLRALSSRQPADQDFFVEAEVDNGNPYFGQQIAYSFRFYYATTVVGRPSYDAPGFAGFWSRPDAEQIQYDATVAGRRYRVLELRTVLFPTIAGPITIDPASLSVPVRAFRSPPALKTEPLNLEVEPLPYGAPKDFSGAVGQFTVRAELDAIAGKVDEPVTMRIILSGQGNIDALPDPEWPAMPNWRAFDGGTNINSGIVDGKLTGSRVYERLLIPSKAGDSIIPPVSYVYFDPEASAFRTITTDPLPISIVPGAQRAPADSSSASGEEELRSYDIRHIKPVPATLGSPSLLLPDQAGYWIAWGVPLVLLLGVGVWRFGKQNYEGDTALVRRLQAYANARSLLTQAKRDRMDPYYAANRALVGYIGDKLHEPVTGMTREVLAGLLAKHGVDPQVILCVKKCLILSDGGRFVPYDGPRDSGQALLNQTEMLISDLEREFGT